MAARFAHGMVYYLLGARWRGAGANAPPGRLLPIAREPCVGQQKRARAALSSSC